MTVTLAAFLLDQLAADEAEAESYPAAWRARVLAHCAAKRVVVGLHPMEDAGEWRNDGDDTDPRCSTCAVEHGGYDPSVPELWPCPTLRALVQPYADREGFDERWLA